MEISEGFEAGVLVLNASGKLTIGRGDVVLRDAVQRALSEGNQRILLDMKKVTWVDSGGIGELVSQFVSTRNRGGALKLFGLSDRVGGVFKATRLTGIFEIFDDKGSALASFE